jgi:hypothetical protein
MCLKSNCLMESQTVVLSVVSDNVKAANNIGLVKREFKNKIRQQFVLSFDCFIPTSQAILPTYRGRYNPKIIIKL